MAFSASYIFRIVDNYTSTINKMNAATQAFNNTVTRTATRIETVGSRLTNLTRTIVSSAAVIGGALLFKNLIKYGTEFEEVMYEIERITNTTGKNLIDISDKIIKSSQIYGLLPTEYGNIYSFLARAGYQAGKEIEDTTQLIAKSRYVFKMSTSDVAIYFSKLRQQFHATSTQMREFADIIAYLDTHTSEFASNILPAVQRLAPVFQQAGAGMKETAFWATQALIPTSSPSGGGGGARMMGSTALARLVDALIQSSNKFRTAFQINFSGSMFALLHTLQGMTSKERDAFLKTTKIGQMYSRIIAKDFIERVDDIEKMWKTLDNENKKYLGAMDSAFNKIQTKLFFTLEITRSKFANLKLSISKAFMRPLQHFLEKTLNPFIDRLTDWVDSHQKLTRWLITISAIGAAMTVTLLVLGLIINGISFLGSMAVWAFGKLSLGVSSFIMAITHSRKELNVLSSLITQMGGAAGIEGFAASVTGGTFMTALMGPLGIILGISAVVIGLITYFHKWGVIIDWISDRWNEFYSVVSSFGNEFIKVWKELTNTAGFKELSSLISTILKGILELLGLLLGTSFKIVFKMMLFELKVIFDVIIAIVKGINWILSHFNKVGEKSIIYKRMMGEESAGVTLNKALGISTNNTTTLNGKIGIEVTGPGKVNQAGIFSTSPGNLGYSFAHSGS